MPSLRSQLVGIDMTGPFFTNPDPGETMLKNMEKMFQALAREGEAAARQNMLLGSGGRALVRATGDRVADHIVGRTVSVNGRQWVSAAVVSVNTTGLDSRKAISVMAAGSLLEGRLHALARVASSIRSSRAVLRANLMAGLE